MMLQAPCRVLIVDDSALVRQVLTEILAADPYPQAYEPTVERNQQEQRADARPAIAGRPRFVSQPAA